MYRSWLVAFALLLAASPIFAVTIARVSSPIVIDGVLDDAAWSSVAPVTTWYEIDPGDNVPSPVRCEAKVAIGGGDLFVAFHFFDPDTTLIRAPFSSRDGISADSDYGGVIIDSQGDGRQATYFYANPRGVQLDGILNDATGDTSDTPDFFWDAAARLTGDGWTLEMRIPLSTLRYSATSPRWRMILVRNWVRGHRRLLYDTQVPRGSACKVCHAAIIEGLDVPKSRQLLLVPYASAQSAPRSAGRVLDGGGDVGYSPSSNFRIDATINPDFSQVESDTLAVATNQRFALSYPEKRPFFLEGLQLFDTPLEIVATRTITSPVSGARVTGTTGTTGYTILVANDRGGGSVIIPGPTSSATAAQDFRSHDVIARVRHDAGNLMIGAVITDREIAGGGYNRVVGPDFRWTRADVDVISGQLLASRSETPRRPDLAAEWDGRKLSSHAANVIWKHTTSGWDWYDAYWNLGDTFRSDLGYVPSVGYRELYTNTGYSIRPRGFLNNVRFYVTTDDERDFRGQVVYHVDTTGTDMLGKGNSMFRIRFSNGELRVADRLIARKQLLFIAQGSPSRRITLIGADGSLGQQIDYSNVRRGNGPMIHYFATLQPVDRLEIATDANMQWIRRERGRVFTAQTERVKASWAFDVRSSVRVIVQNDHTNRGALLYDVPVSARSGSLATSVLYQRRINYATGVFVGVGDSRALDDTTSSWLPPQHSLFAKISYALSR